MSFTSSVSYFMYHCRNVYNISGKSTFESRTDAICASIKYEKLDKQSRFRNLLPLKKKINLQVNFFSKLEDQLSFKCSLLSGPNILRTKLYLNLNGCANLDLHIYYSKSFITIIYYEPSSRPDERGRGGLVVNRGRGFERHSGLRVVPLSMTYLPPPPKST